MSRIIYRGFDAAAGKSLDGKDEQERVYRGIRFVPTNRKTINAKTGAAKRLYRGIVSIELN